MSLSKMMIAPIIPLWLILLLFFLGLAATFLQYWFIQKRLGRSRAFGLSLLRLGALTLIISFALNPFLLVRKEQKISPEVSILIDTSPSMSLSQNGGKGSRMDEAKSLLLKGPKPLLKSLSERFVVKLYALGESLRIVNEEELADLKAGEKKADLSDALKKLNPKSSLALLFSDGNLKWEKSTSMGAPLHILPLGDPKGYKDILIKAVKAPAIAFRGREVLVDVTLKSYGYTGMMLPVVLKEGSRVLTAKNVHMGETPTDLTLTLSFVPEKVGPHNLDVSIPSQFGESLTSNNNVRFSLKVVRDKIRILMISGNPSLNYRFMRMALKNDPSIDLLSFVILRTPSNILNVPLQEQSLIPIPVETLFTKELKDFDLLIFDNLPYHLYLSPNYYEKVREFIREGGGFAMIGGPYLFDGGRYTGTPIGEILPVKLNRKEDYDRDSPTGVKLTRAGMGHPVTQFSSDEAENLSFWREMPTLDGVNLLERKSSGTVLLESTDGSSLPILTVGSYGRGRVLVLATDYSWKWYMGMVSKNKGNWVYLRLMERMVRWLTKDPDLETVQVIPPEQIGIAGEEVEFRIREREEKFSKGTKGMVSLSIFNPDGIKIGSQIKTSGKAGEFIGSFLPEKGGTYKVKIETPFGPLEESLVITGRLEDMDAAPDHEHLRIISSSTGGETFTQGDDLLKKIEVYGEKNQGSFVEEKRTPLWGMPYTLVIILVLLGAEWYFRRKWGLL